MDNAAILTLISRAWGRKQEDEMYCFFPWIDREEQARAGIRRAGFHDGPVFVWPRDRKKIIAHMEEHEDHDLYWCPSLFEQPQRLSEYATDEKALWADLDEVDPREITDYPPTIAWETSPDRYQALWILNQGDIQGASWPGNENQKMTYHLGADQGGWDTTQLLRLPGWTNHKLHYKKKYGEYPKGKLLWKNKQFYQADDFQDLPVVEGALPASQLTEAVAGQVENVDINAVKARIRLDLTRRTREMLDAREAVGDRSSALWDLERSLADVGCSVEEIVALVRVTVWNKYEDRADELKRLIIEATKAVAAKGDKLDRVEVLREEADAAIPQRLDILLQNIKPPKWLVQDLLTEGGLGFIAGEPKSFKSWLGLDLALSVASGSRFLNHFDILNPGPVLYLQEEDSPITVKRRVKRISRDKKTAQVHLDGNGGVEFHPPGAVSDDAPVNALLQGGVIISEGVWQEWLDETLSKGYIDDSRFESEPYRLVIIDTLMMVAGDVEENRAQEMTTKIFKPVKQVARKHEVALIFVHHSRKSSQDQKRGGQRMLGSVANHAWAEDSMYLMLGNTKRVEMETESKSFESRHYIIDGIGGGKGWQPTISTKGEELAQQSKAVQDNSPEKIENTAQRQKAILLAMKELGKPVNITTLSMHMNRRPPTIRRGLLMAERKNQVRRISRTLWVVQ